MIVEGVGGGPSRNEGSGPCTRSSPPTWISRALRVAMAAEDWARFDALVDELSFRASTQARAHGEAISNLLHDRPESTAGPSHWMDWERQKALRLLQPAN